MSALTRTLRLCAVVGTTVFVMLPAGEAHAAHAQYLGTIVGFDMTTDVLTISTGSGAPMAVQVVSDTHIIPTGQCSSSGPVGTAALVQGVAVINVQAAKTSTTGLAVAQHIILACST